MQVLPKTFSQSTLPESRLLFMRSSCLHDFYIMTLRTHVLQFYSFLAFQYSWPFVIHRRCSWTLPWIQCHVLLRVHVFFHSETWFECSIESRWTWCIWRTIWQPLKQNAQSFYQVRIPLKRHNSLLNITIQIHMSRIFTRIVIKHLHNSKHMLTKWEINDVLLYLCSILAYNIGSKYVGNYCIQGRFLPKSIK